MKKLLVICVILLIAGWGIHTQHTTAETRLLAALGDSKAQFMLGGMYYQTQDYEKALTWYLKAAEHGYPNAQFSVGVMYGNGIGVPVDDKKGFEWYLKAAEQGLVAAQYNLAACYHNGEGVAKDNVSSYMWVNLAALQGEPVAIGNKEILAKEMTPEQIAKAEQLSNDWLAKHRKP